MVRSEVATQIWTHNPPTPLENKGGTMCPPRTLETAKGPALNRVKELVLKTTIEKESESAESTWRQSGTLHWKGEVGWSDACTSKLSRTGFPYFSSHFLPCSVKVQNKILYLSTPSRQTGMHTDSGIDTGEVAWRKSASLFFLDRWKSFPHAGQNFFRSDRGFQPLGGGIPHKSDI